MTVDALPLRVDALVFDAYGTLYDVHSVAQRCESFFPGAGQRLSQLWRVKQLEYTWLRSLMRRYAPFSVVTREALAHSCEALSLPLGVTQMEALMAEYQMLAPFPRCRRRSRGCACARRSSRTARPTCSSRWCATRGSSSTRC